MTARSRLLSGVDPPHGTTNNATAPLASRSNEIDSDFVVILASLLCALICVLGLVAVARCAWIRRLAAGERLTEASAANKGVKKKVLRSLPRMTYGDDCEQAANLSDCAICLAEFESGEEVRVLPQCGHGFHRACIDTWLSSHSSCPSCRQLLRSKTAARCQECGGLPANECSTTAVSGIRPEPREGHVSRSSPHSS